MTETPVEKATLSLADALFAEDQAAGASGQVQVECAEDSEKVPSQLSASAEPWHPTNGSSETAAKPLDAASVPSLVKQPEFAWGFGEHDHLEDFAAATTTTTTTTTTTDTTSQIPLIKIDPNLRAPPGLELPEGIPSHGSTLHALGRCKPCAWFYKRGSCSNKGRCKHCHLCPDGEIKARKRNAQKPSALQGDLSAQEPMTSSASTVSPSSQEASVHSDSEPEWLSDDQEAAAALLPSSKRTAAADFQSDFSAELYAKMPQWPDEEMLWRQHYEQQCMAEYWGSMDMGFGDPYGGYDASLGAWGGM